MAVDEDCRQVVYAGAAAAVAAPLFRAIPPAAKVHNGFAPAITIMANMSSSWWPLLPPLYSPKPREHLAESLSLKAKGIDGPYTSNLGA